mgnify:CR=1 FL=1
MKKQTYRKPPKPLEGGPAGLVHWVLMCEKCGKHSYRDRADARRVARRHHPKKSVYECPDQPGLWHVGGLASVVRHGQLARSEVYG